MKPLIDHKRVWEIMQECMFPPDEIKQLGEGVIMEKCIFAKSMLIKDIGLDPERLALARKEIYSICANLAPPFQQLEGWPIWYLGLDKNYTDWSGSWIGMGLRQVDALSCLGQAVGVIKLLAPLGDIRGGCTVHVSLP